MGQCKPNGTFIVLPDMPAYLDPGGGLNDLPVSCIPFSLSLSSPLSFSREIYYHQRCGMNNERARERIRGKAGGDTVTVHCTPVDHRLYHTHRSVLAWFVIQTHTYPALRNTERKRDRGRSELRSTIANIIVMWWPINGNGMSSPGHVAVNVRTL